MTIQELAQTVGRGVASCPDRQPFQVALDIFAEDGRGRVAAIRLLAQRRHDDRVEIAAQAPAQLLGRGPAGRGRLRPIDRLRWRQRRRIQDDALDVRDASPSNGVGQAPGEKVVQDQTERVHVRGRGGRLTPHLLRSGVLGRHRPQTGERHGAGRVSAFFGQQPGDAEVQQLDPAIVAYQDVGGLQVAVHDEPLVGVLHGLADVMEQPQTILDRGAPRVAVLGDRRSFHVLHGEEGAAVHGDAAVEKTRDVRMLQARQDLPLAQEARVDLVGVESALQDLDGGPLLELAVGALRVVDHPHPAPSDFAQQAPDTDPLALEGLARRALIQGLAVRHAIQQFGGAVPRGTIQDTACDCEGLQEVSKERPAVRVAFRHALQERGPLGLRDIERLVEERRELLPPLGGDLRLHRASS